MRTLLIGSLCEPWGFDPLRSGPEQCAPHHRGRWGPTTNSAPPISSRQRNGNRPLRWRRRAFHILERTLVGTYARRCDFNRHHRPVPCTGTYHGVIHSRLDAVDCHVMFAGKGYNGQPMEDIKAAGWCPKGNINALKEDVVIRAILFDREAMEKLEHVKG